MMPTGHTHHTQTNAAQPVELTRLPHIGTVLPAPPSALSTVLLPVSCATCHFMSSMLSDLVREAKLVAKCAFETEAKLKPTFNRILLLLRVLAQQIAICVNGSDLLRFRHTIRYVYRLSAITMDQAESASTTVADRIVAACIPLPDPLPPFGCAACEELCNQVCGMLVYNQENAISDVEEIKRGISAAVQEICQEMEFCFIDLSAIHSIIDGSLVGARTATMATVKELHVELRSLKVLVATAANRTLSHGMSAKHKT